MSKICWKTSIYVAVCGYVLEDEMDGDIQKTRLAMSFLIGNTAKCICKALLHYVVYFWYFAY